eukprot:CAMPEP_0119344868 /NCGR_PEP_ID=MMETSP1333-20130426/107191_1 /TAXON_ID=418940 /ORGANISM="Scyphosphaera apsteinii, Strain RCC1455" /LENGTH=109 /DNA_ID=CAMNT_0007357317 /DNA_START=650 /DNA_END=977 /DNA_ORIENTATION=+
MSDPIGTSTLLLELPLSPTAFSPSAFSPRACNSVLIADGSSSITGRGALIGRDHTAARALSHSLAAHRRFVQDVATPLAIVAHPDGQPSQLRYAQSHLHELKPSVLEFW